MNSKQKRRALRQGVELVLHAKKPVVGKERTYKAIFKKVGANTYTCAGHTITVKKRHEPEGFKPEYYLFEESRRIADTISEIRWTLDYEYYSLWRAVDDIESGDS